MSRPGDVLHHHAAGLHELAFEGDELHADDEIARGAVEAAARAAGIGGDDAADGGVFGKRADRAAPSAGVRRAGG